jgi:hypothetical protein
MSYTLKLTNGTILTTLADQTTDRVTTSVTLIGKNVNAYGADLNDNFVRLLENFASATEPTSPLIGQLWYDSNAAVLKIYARASNVTGKFKPVGSPIVSNIAPTYPTAGDLWVDTSSTQLKFYDGNSFIPASQSAGTNGTKSGLTSEQIIDSNLINKHVTGLWANGTLLGLISDESFTFHAPFPTDGGMTGVGVGINLNTSTSAVNQVKFIGTATSAESINGLNANTLVSTVSAATNMNGRLAILNDLGLSVGAYEDIRLYITYDGITPTANLKIAGLGENFNIITNSTSGIPALHFDSINERIGVFNTSPVYAFDITGDARVTGNLHVEGNSTYITTHDLQVNDKNIVLAYTTGTADDSVANEGGIILKGTTDKSILWDVGSAAWNSSESIGIAGGKTYNVNGTPVLSSTELGSSVRTASGLTSIGRLTTFEAGNLSISTGTIGTTNGGAIKIGINATEIDFNGKHLRNVATPNITDTFDVATVGYVESAVTRGSGGGQYSITLDVTGHWTDGPGYYGGDVGLDAYVCAWLTRVYPPVDPYFGITELSRARVILTSLTVPAQTLPSNYLDLTSVTVDKNNSPSSVYAVEYSSTYRADTPYPATSPTVHRAVLQYQVYGAVWVRLNVDGITNTVYTDGTW